MKKNYNNNALDLFRILATVQVFLGHFITHFVLPSQLTETSHLYNAVYFLRGVPILFALCGFLAAKSLEHYSPKEYLIRRGFRILPGFWVCILVNTLIIFLLYGIPSFRDGVIYFVTQLLGLNFYTGDWLRGYGVGTPNGVLWTIGVQIQFFILAPMLHKLLKKLKLSGSMIFVGILTVLSIAIEKCSPILPEMLYKLVGVTVVPYLYFLVLGMAAWSYRNQLIAVLEKLRWIILPVFVLWKIAENTLQFPHIFDGVMYNTITTLLTAMLIFAFAFRFKWRLKKDLTYGFYLYHMVFINIAVHCGHKTLGANWQSAVVIVAVTLLPTLLAWLSQTFIEDPAAKLYKKKEGV